MKTLQSELIEKGIAKACTRETNHKSSKNKDKHSKRMTDKELRELMGVNRDTYRRGPGGAFRRR